MLFAKDWGVILSSDGEAGIHDLVGKVYRVVHSRESWVSQVIV